MSEMSFTSGFSSCPFLDIVRGHFKLLWNGKFAIEHRWKMENTPCRYITHTQPHTHQSHPQQKWWWWKAFPKWRTRGGGKGWFIVLQISVLSHDALNVSLMNHFPTNKQAKGGRKNPVMQKVLILPPSKYVSSRVCRACAVCCKTQTDTPFNTQSRSRKPVHGSWCADPAV